MTKIKGPLHSISASGSICDKITFSLRDSGQQVRWQKKQRDVITEARTEARTAYSNAVIAWRLLSDSEKETWKEQAIGSELTGYNLFVQEYIYNYSKTDVTSFFGVGVFGVCIFGNF